MAADVTVDELTGMIAGGVKAAMMEAMGEVEELRNKAAAAAADVLTKEQFETALNEKVGEANAKITALEQAVAEAKFTPPVDGSAEIVWPLDAETLVQAPADERVLQAQKLNDELYMLHKALGYGPQQLSESRAMQRARKHFGEKALDTTTSGGISQWIPTGYSAQLVEAVAIETRLANMFDHINMPTKTYVSPVQVGWPTVYLASENVAITESTAALSGNFSLAARDIGAYQGISSDASEDSIIPILPRMQRLLAQGLARGIENAILNGDVSGTHQDSDTDALGATAVQKAWSGLRFYALNTAGCSEDLATFTADACVTLKQDMGIYGIAPNDLAWIAGPSVLNQLLLLKDANNNLVMTTVDKYGAQATIVTGEVGKLFGIPVIPSEFVRETLNASGVYDGVTMTKTALQLVNRTAWVVGDRRNIQSEQDKDIVAQTVKLVTTWRGDFKAVFAAGQTHTVMGYNITA